VQPVRVDVISGSRRVVEEEADLGSLTFGVGPREIDGRKVDGFGYYETIG